MAGDLNATAPTPGDPDYYDYTTKTGKYDPKKIANAKKAKLASGKVKQGGKKSGLAERGMGMIEDEKKRKARFSGGIKDMLFGE